MRRYIDTIKKGLIFFVLISVCVFAAWVSTESTEVEGETEGTAGIEGSVEAAAENEESGEDGESSEDGLDEDLTAGILHDSEKIYEQDKPESIQTMYLTVRRGNASENTDHSWESINKYSVYDYEYMGKPRYQVAAILQVGDENGPKKGEFGYGVKVPNATVQIRGQTSSRSEQKSYKIEIKKEKGTYQGQRTIALNKHVYDGLRIRNKLMYDLMKDVPYMFSARTQFVHLYVKDETGDGDSEFVYYGLYTQVEQINKTYLENHGLSKNGHLYKINLFEFLMYDEIKLKNDAEYDQAAFENRIEIKGNDDHSKLIELLEDVNDFSKPIEETFEKWFEPNNFFTWMAFHILTGNTDTQSRNLYIYSPLNSNTWYFISWDNDAAFKRSEYNMLEKERNGGHEKGFSNYWGNRLFQRVLKNEDYRAMLHEKILEVKSILTEEKIADMANSYSEVVKPFLYRKPDVLYTTLTKKEVEQVVKALPSEIELNYELYLENLEEPMPFYIGIPTVIEKSGKLYYNWDTAFDFDNEDITYCFELAKDYYFEDMVYTVEDIIVPYLEVKKLKPGQYFIRVTAKNESGYEQRAFDYYVTTGEKQYGVKSFFVMEDGTIEEDVYEE